MEKHSVSRIIGSPPGYVGYDEAGQMTEKVRRKPYSVILFDEIEKAHPDVFNVLLQVLDDGHITDSQGRKVDFSNTVIIMTSNAGAKAIIDPKKLGFAAKEDKVGDYKKMKQGVMEEVKQIFRPEFLNRIDEMIVFHTLDKENMKKIVSLLCNEFTGRLEKQMNIHLKLRNSAKELIVEKGTDTKYGARPLRRALQTELEDKLADAILNGDILNAPTKKIPYFNFEVPTELTGVDTGILDPRDTYADASEWEEKAKDLAGRFIKNFAKYEGNAEGKALVPAGPQK
mgnify:CR=1 FL=1